MNRSIRLASLAVCAFVGIVMTTRCGGHAQTPAAPSDTQTTVTAPPATPTPSATGATIVGVVSTTASASRQGLRAFDVPSGVIVTVGGTTAAAPLESSGTFTLTCVPPIDVVLNFSGPGISAALPLGTIAAAEQVQITVILAGTSASLDAQQRTTSDNAVQADGRIEDIDAGPRRFLLKGTVV